ncbi:hypothetical protein K432DRAFT_284269, partial [Lepidopterella palustris CBS 459.81]
SNPPTAITSLPTLKRKAPWPETTNPRPSKAAIPTRVFFDPWNSSSTGHQRAENRLAGSASWRDSTNLKLSAQFRARGGGGERIAGAGSGGFGRRGGRRADGEREGGARGWRVEGQRSLREVLRREGSELGGGVVVVVEDERDMSGGVGEEEDGREGGTAEEQDAAPKQKQIFQGLCVYINGSTAPLVSDHKLKLLLAERGARMSIALGRRSVTHVILGAANEAGGSGGGLAGGKIQKEIQRVGGKGVKFVGVEWVIESIKANKRLPESRFSTLKLAPKGQESVLKM